MRMKKNCPIEINDLRRSDFIDLERKAIESSYVHHHHRRRRRRRKYVVITCLQVSTKWL